MEDNNSQSADPNAFSPRSAQALRELEERARAALSVQRGQVSRLEQEVFQRLDAITAAIAEHRAAEGDEAKLVGEARSELEKLHKEIAEARSAWQRERDEQKSALEKERKELEARGAKQDQRAKQLADLGCELDARNAALDEQSLALSKRNAELEERASTLRAEAAQHSTEHHDFAAREAAWTDERQTIERQRDELAEKLAKLEAQQRKDRDEWQKQLADFEQKLHDQQASWSERKTEWEKARTGLEQERDGLQQKFELALEDVQRFRSRVAEVEQDLARRPEASQADSAELVALRAERDELADRLEQLERQPTASGDEENEQQLADLQRRFELAVEDVRELKTKNAELESQLAAAAKKSGGHTDAGGMDWESQKRRMLASLEGEGEEEIDEEREKERASIENTIEMTDAVVAEKDREIEELKTQLAEAGSTKVEAKDDRQEKLNELLDADEVIAEHRERMAQLERDMQDKLRTAELELSVERAKIARQKAELEELRTDLESQRDRFSGGPGGAVGTPRRRWLSKLGLTGEEQ
jgi:chromosome segregation ATPase